MGFDEFEESVDDGQTVEIYTFSTSAEVLYRQTTSLDPVVIDGQTYEPTALSRSGTQASSDLQAEGNLSIECAPSHPIVRLFLNSDPAEVVMLEVQEFQRGDPDEEVVGVWKGFVRSANLAGKNGVMNCTPIPGIKREGLGIGYIRPCPYQLYDADTCKADRADFTIEGTVDSVDGSDVVAAIFDTMPDGWLSGGFLRFGDGKARLIVSHEGDTVTLLYPIAGLTVGDEIEAEAGCDRSKATCIAKFDNLLNYGGFPWIPNKNPFQSGIEV